MTWKKNEIIINVLLVYINGHEYIYKYYYNENQWVFICMHVCVDVYIYAYIRIYTWIHIYKCIYWCTSKSRGKTGDSSIIIFLQSIKCSPIRQNLVYCLLMNKHFIKNKEKQQKNQKWVWMHSNCVQNKNTKRKTRVKWFSSPRITTKTSLKQNTEKNMANIENIWILKNRTEK